MDTSPDIESSFSALFRAGAYGLDAEQKAPLMLAALQASYRHHFQNCPAYRHFCQQLGFHEQSIFDNLSDFPFLPVQAFKAEAHRLRSVPESAIQTTLASSATQGIPSQVVVDKLTAKRQVKALSSVLSEVLGGARRPFLILDADPRTHVSSALGARSAATRGFLNLAREAQYFMELRPDQSLNLLHEPLIAALEHWSQQNEPVCIFGFTYVLYHNAIVPLQQAGRTFRLPEGSKVAHIGGWKKLIDRKVDKSDFNRAVATCFGVPESAVVDFYGFTEQMGLTYPDQPEGVKLVPAFAEVIVRDPATLAPLPDGVPGLLQFLTPLPTSYPGFSVLTEDLGCIVGRAPLSSARQGTQFKLIGRAPRSEPRGCGDILGEKMTGTGPPTRPRSDMRPAAPVASSQSARLLWDAIENYTGNTLDAPLALDNLPQVSDLSALALRLREQRAELDTYGVDELCLLIHHAAQRWVAPESPLRMLRGQGLQFLYQWCQPTALRRLADRSLHGKRGHLDQFMPADGTHRRMLRAQARGLVVHWLAGNVPLLGMLALVQCILAKNANLLKASAQYAAVLPTLLDAFRGLEVPLPTGRMLRGDALLKTIAVVYFPREDTTSAEAISQAANVRIVWGGREAVETVSQLPRPLGCEDVILGPKLSYAVVGKERLAHERIARRTARQAATDISVFDQTACSSPHTLFVETGGDAYTPETFAVLVAEELDKAAVRIPKIPVDAALSAQIEGIRLVHRLKGRVWQAADTAWTVLYEDESDAPLAPACGSRVITVRAIDDCLNAARFANPDIQTIGLGLEGERRLAFAQAAASRGAERFPDLGRMSFFDAPWDGLFMLDRLVRWVSLGGPF